MPITFNCHRCGVLLGVADDQAGGLAQCPACKIVCPVPEELDPVEELPPEDAEVLAEEGAERDAPLKPWARAGGRELRRPASSHWRSFADGCKFARWGVFVEALGVGLMFLLLEAAILDSTDILPLPRDAPKAEYFQLVLLSLFAAGTLLIAVGRMMMLRVPAGTAGVAVLIVAAGLSWLRLVLLVLALVLLFVAVVGGGNVKGKIGSWPGRVYALAVLAGWVAEVSAVPGLAVVGGEMPSRELRRRAAAITFVFQLMAVIWIAMFVSATYMEAMQELAPARPANQVPVQGVQRADPVTRAAALTTVLLIGFALQMGYAYLNYSLYAVGQRVGYTDGDSYP